MKSILEIIKDKCMNAGTCVPLCEVEQLWRKNGGETGLAFTEQLGESIQMGTLHIEGYQVYLERVWRQEVYVAERLRDLLIAPPLPAPVLPGRIRVGDITLTDEQRRAVATCLSRRLTLVLAKAGCGKTTVAKAIIEYSGARNAVLTSPTGKAAKILSQHTGYQATTIHRSLDIHTDDDFLYVTTKEDVDLIIVDEGTMLTIDMLAGLLRAAKKDCRIVIMGDRHQLPAVGPGNVIGDLVELGFPCVTLAQNHRQRNSCSALWKNVVGFDKISWRADLSEDESFQCRYDENEAHLMDALVEDAVAKYRRGEDAQVLSLRNHDVLEMNRRIQAKLNPGTKLTIPSNKFEYRDGDRVILTANDNDRGCYNGEVGILRIHDDMSFSVLLDGMRFPTWACDAISKMILPAYAITVHRAQGSEYKTVLMFVPRCNGGLLHRNSFYTGISRASEQLLLYANPKAIQFGLQMRPCERRSQLVSRVKLDLETSGFYSNYQQVAI